MINLKDIKLNIRVEKSIDSLNFQPVTAIYWKVTSEFMQDARATIGDKDLALMVGTQILDAIKNAN